MKKILVLSIILIVIFSTIATAQSPQKVNYQAVVRDASGNAITNKTISLRISILQGSAFGTFVYVETHSPLTNQFGLVTIAIGDGIVTTGSFSGIDWSAGPYFLKVELDATGGTSYSEMGTTQLLSVPYSLYSQNSEHSQTAATVETIDYSQLENKPDLSVYTQSSVTGKWDKDSTNDVTLTGNQTISGKKTFGDSLLAGSTIKASINKSSGTAIIGENNSTTGSGFGVKGLSDSSIGYGIYGEATSATGSNQGVYGKSYSVAGFGVKGFSPYIGVYGYTTSTAGSVGYGVQGVSFNPDGFGVCGLNASNTGEAIGVYGRSSSTGGIGIYGSNNISSGENYGVFGENHSFQGAGVKGESSSSSGVYGSTMGSNGSGVKGENLSTGGYGVYGISKGIGVYGETIGNTGSAMYAIANDVDGSTVGLNVQNKSSAGKSIFAYSSSTTGNTYGVQAYVTSPDGIAVQALNTGDSGNGYGLYARSLSPTGKAISANANSQTGSPIAVFGYCSSPSGYDFYASGQGVSYGSKSSIRWKKDIRIIDNVLSKIRNLNGVYYTWDQEHGSRHDLGFIGEEVAKYFPEIVVPDLDAPGFVTGMDYSKMTPILLQAINEQQEIIETQNKQIQDLLKRVEALETK
jgi:hypothetical protein